MNSWWGYGLDYAELYRNFTVYRNLKGKNVIHEKTLYLTACVFGIGQALIADDPPQNADPENINHFVGNF